MVGPSLSRSDREAYTRRLRVVITALVGASTGLVALYGRGSLLVVAGSILAGVIVGAFVAWYVVPDASRWRDPGDSRRRR